MNKIFKLASLLEKKYFYKIANNLLSPDDIKKFFENHISEPFDILIKIDKTKRALFVQLDKLKSKSASIAIQNLKKLDDWYNNIYMKYYEVIYPLIDKNNREYFRSLFDASEMSDASDLRSELLEIIRLSEKFKQVKEQNEYMLHKHHYGGDMYIRFGKFSKEEQSEIKLDDEWKQEQFGHSGQIYEMGISAYQAENINGKWRLVDANQIAPNRDIRKSKGAKYHYTGMQISLFEKAIKLGHIYLVTGDLLKEPGTDGECLLRNVFPVKKLSTDDILMPHSQDETLRDYINEKTQFSKGFDPKFDEKLQFILRGEDLVNEYLELSEGIKENKPKYRLSSDEENFLKEIKLKLNNHNRSYNDYTIISQEEKDKLYDIVKKLHVFKNKELVMKGFRPLY